MIYAGVHEPKICRSSHILYTMYRVLDYICHIPKRALKPLERTLQFVGTATSRIFIYLGILDVYYTYIYIHIYMCVYIYIYMSTYLLFKEARVFTSEPLAQAGAASDPLQPSRPPRCSWDFVPRPLGGSKKWIHLKVL